jgi:ATP-dependent RNA helicase DHX37/DHR1
MKKFVPRQRKHKVIARNKDKSNESYSAIDSNATEHIPASKTEHDEKKRALKEQLQNELPKVSGKKAKRLEKYIETKLRKDENRELIEKLAASATDTSHYQSSRKLGQGKETKREQLSRALRDRAAGIDVDGDQNEILFKKEPIKAQFVEEESSEEEDDEPQHDPKPLQESVQIPQPKPVVALGTGLKRPLEVDDEGKPVIQKRQRRGGVKSKISFKSDTKQEPETEPAWGGFSSASEMDTEDSEADDSPEESDSEEAGSEHDESVTEFDEAHDDEDDDEDKEEGDEDDTSSEESDSEDKIEARKERSSAFKAWANQQRDQAMGFQPTSNIQNATDTKKPENFQPRAPEQDPLPLELQTTSNVTRKAFSVTITRTPEIQDIRLKLPVVAEEQKIMEAIHNNSTVVVYGATGSGKTTQVPQFLYEAGYGSPNSPTPGMIGVTQPRRVAAVSMAKRVGDELGDHGNRVSYQIRFEGTVGAQTAIKFMTDGVLLREVAQDIALRKYSAIVIDEAHERSVNTDILIGMLSRVVKLRDEMALEDPSIKPLKLIIMSATLRVTDFTENTTLFSTPPPVLQAEGRQYPVTSHFSRKTPHDYVDEAFRKISRGHKKLPPGGFLVFMTGQNEITHLSKRLKEAFRSGTTASGPQVRISGQDAPVEAEDVDFGDVMDAGGDSDDDSVELNIDDDDEFEVGEEGETGPAKIHVLPLYSLLPTREQLRVFEDPPDGARLVVLATNVAETSLTIPGIRYVFDCGRSKERKYDRQTGVQSFEVGWISKASASQRAGRAGRTGPGHCYKLYSSAVFERDFQEFAEPEILRMPIEGVVLQLKAMNLQHVVNFPFPTPPDRSSLASSEKLLTYLSAISPSGQITPSGITMSIFPLSPRFARILLIGHLHECLPYTIALVAGLSAADIFIAENQIVPKIAPKAEDEHFTMADRLEEDARNQIQRAYNKVHKSFCFLDDKSDAIKLLQVVGEYAHEPTEAWCQSHFVRSKPLREILQLRRQITDLLRTNIPTFANLKFQEKLDPPSIKQVKALKQMVAAGFIDHVAIRANLAPNPPATRRKPARSIDVPYLALFPTHTHHDEEDKAVYIHPSSPLAHISPGECPDYIIYSHLQRAAPAAATPEKIPKARMHALTDISGGQLAALAKGTPLITYGKPIKEVMPREKSIGEATTRECWVIPYLRAEATGGVGWPLPARKVTQKKVAGRGWVVE